MPRHLISDAHGLTRASHCPYLLSSETAAKGTDFVESAGKEDPVELDSSLTLRKDTRRCRISGSSSLRL